MQKRFHPSRLEQLRRLHELKKSRVHGFNMRQFFALVLGAAAVVVRTTPRSVVTTQFGIPYEQFETWVFWGMVAVLGYVLVIGLPIWWQHFAAKQLYDYGGYVLDYALIDSEETPRVEVDERLAAIAGVDADPSTTLT